MDRKSIERNISGIRARFDSRKQTRIDAQNEEWITINGTHVPLDDEGNITGNVAEKIKASQNKSKKEPESKIPEGAKDATRADLRWIKDGTKVYTEGGSLTAKFSPIVGCRSLVPDDNDSDIPIIPLDDMEYLQHFVEVYSPKTVTQKPKEEKVKDSTPKNYYTASGKDIRTIRSMPNGTSFKDDYGTKYTIKYDREVGGRVIDSNGERMPIDVTDPDSVGDLIKNSKELRSMMSEYFW